MTAQLANLNPIPLAGPEEAGTGPDGFFTPRTTSEQPLPGSMQFDCGYLSPFFVTDPLRMEVVFEDAYVLLREQKIRSMKHLLPILEQIAKSGRPLLIIAEDLEDEALATLVVNMLRGTMHVAAAKASGSGHQRKAVMKALALFTGARVFTEDLGIKLENVQISDLGRAQKIKVDRKNTIILGRCTGQVELTTHNYSLENLVAEMANLASKGHQV